ncbi:hypothetical protein STIAU_4956 [Stigmatella aurantiaca DW4/3-1]|uniref:Uncharacterized protein n=1 Tax=Stigmatella aurantiaca (strain DW4/3-1) TaxID=378806 RepID=Q094X0_STIAD|nr:hypothetical protein STIAU_4956 [Stigmatella aurantiaca DW4/3-1]
MNAQTLREGPGTSARPCGSAHVFECHRLGRTLAAQILRWGDGRLQFPVRLRVAALKDRLAQLPHQFLVVAHVVDGQHPRAQVVLAPHQVLQIAARVARAHRTVTRRIQRGVVQPVDHAGNPHQAVEGVRIALLRHLRGDDAVEHVHAPHHRFQQVRGRAHPHQVARLVRGQRGRGPGGHRLALLLGLPHRQPANGEAIERQPREELRALVAQARVDTALDDAEQRLARGHLVLGRQAAHGPPVGALHRLARARLVRARVDAHIQHHHDLRVDRLLHGDARLGAEHLTAVVVEAAELRPLLGDEPVLRQREDLKPPRVRQNGPIPPHEGVDAAELAKHLRPRPKHQVVGVGQQDAAPRVPHLLRTQVAESGVGGHRHEHGGEKGAAARVEHPGTGPGGVRGDEFEADSHGPGVIPALPSAAPGGCGSRSLVRQEGDLGLHGLAAGSRGGWHECRLPRVTRIPSGLPAVVMPQRVWPQPPSR